MSRKNKDPACPHCGCPTTKISGLVTCVNCGWLEGQQNPSGVIVPNERRYDPDNPGSGDEGWPPGTRKPLDFGQE